jgi:hypothetical protein
LIRQIRTSRAGGLRAVNYVLRPLFLELVVMTMSDGLTLVTLIVATISMLLSCIALWPQSKQMLSFVRDVVLWMVLVFIFVGAATLGWRHYRVYYQRRLPSPPTDVWETDPAVIDANYSQPLVSTTPAQAAHGAGDPIAWGAGRGH